MISHTELRGCYMLESLEAITLNGDAYTDESALYRACREQRSKLTPDVFAADKRFLLGEGFLHREGTRLYLSKTWRYEESAAKALAEILYNNSLPLKISLPEQLTVGDRVLTAEQRSAVEIRLNHRLSLILGGAGTGKTTLIRALAQYKDYGISVVCAPTGKAARSLTERTGMEGRTVHSALGRLPEQDFLAPVQWQLTKLVVVDEASMMTLEMMAGILSIAPPDCRIVLVGDPKQLLSVDSGNVLPDLLPLQAPYMQLETCHRQASEGGALLHNVQEFAHCACFEDLEFDDHFRFILMSDDKVVKFFLCREAAKRYLAGENVQVLSPFNRSGELSAAGLNQALRVLVNPPAEEKRYLCQKRKFFMDGDRVMMTKNDWERNICNGDIGTLYVNSFADEPPCYIVEHGKRQAVWEDWEGFFSLDLTYAITVHKSQGSEYDTILLPVVRRFHNLLYRNLINTAIARAKKDVILVGDADALSSALGRYAAPRKSMLVQKTHMVMHKIA